MKFQNIKDQEKILKASREKRRVIHRVRNHSYPIGIVTLGNSEVIAFQFLRENRTLNQIKTFSDVKALRNYLLSDWKKKKKKQRGHKAVKQKSNL